MIDPLETRPIPGAPGYLARADGQILRARDGRVLKQNVKGRYWQTQVYINSEQRQRRVHSLVARAFHGERPGPDCWVSFKNDNPLDCRAENLCWMRDRYLQRQGYYGEAAPGSKLTEEQVIKALNRVVAGEPVARIAASLSVTPKTIRNIVKGKNWPHIPRPEGLKHIKVRAVLEPVEPVAA